MPLKYYNYLKENNVGSNKYPVHNHLIFETTVGIYLVDSADRTKLYSLNVSSGTVSQVDVDPSNTSGDQKSRDRNIIAAWHDRGNEKIWFVDCGNPDSQFDVWYLDYSGGLGSEAVTEVGIQDVSGDLNEITVSDIFKISTDFFVMSQSSWYIIIYTVTSSPFVLTSLLSTRSYGFFGGGDGAAIYDIIDYISITTAAGNAIDRGDLTVARREIGTVWGPWGSTYGFFAGGLTDPPSYSNVIDYINTTLITGNAIDKGDLTVGRIGAMGCSGQTYGFFGGGYDGSMSNVIDYITVTTTSGNAIDKGDLTVARYVLSSVSGTLYGFFGGGGTSLGGSPSNIIDYIDTASTTGNAIDKGDLTSARLAIGGLTGATYGFFGGGLDAIPAIVNIIDYIDITTVTGNAVDKGDLTAVRYVISGVTGGKYGFFGGGLTTGDTLTNIIDYINCITTTGNASDKGDLTVSRFGTGGI